jgi:hypothetical protein
MNKNQNYLKEFLLYQLMEVTTEIHKLASEENKYGLEQPQWQINGHFDGLVFRRDWINIQLEELSK